MLTKLFSRLTRKALAPEIAELKAFLAVKESRLVILEAQVSIGRGRSGLVRSDVVARAAVMELREIIKKVKSLL